MTDYILNLKLYTGLSTNSILIYFEFGHDVIIKSKSNWVLLFHYMNYISIHRLLNWELLFCLFYKVYYHYIVMRYLLVSLIFCVTSSRSAVWPDIKESNFYYINYLPSICYASTGKRSIAKRWSTKKIVCFMELNLHILYNKTNFNNASRCRNFNEYVNIIRYGSLKSPCPNLQNQVAEQITVSDSFDT